MVRARAAAILMSGQDGGNLPLKILAVPLLPQGETAAREQMGSAGAAVVVDVEGEALLREIGGREPDGEAPPLETVPPETLPLEIYVYAVTAEGAVEGQATAFYRLDLDRHRRHLETAGFKAMLTLPLSPGEHRLRVLLRTGAGGFGVRSHDVKIPSAAGLSPPLMAEEGPWLVGIGPEAAGAGYPFLVDGRRLAPKALPKLEGEGPWDLWMAAPAGTGALEADFRHLDGRSAAVTEALMEEEGSSPPSRDLLRLRLAPPEIPSGPYGLQLRTRGQDGRLLESPLVPVVLEMPRRRNQGPPRVAREETGPRPGPPRSSETIERYRKLYRQRLVAAAEEAAEGASGDPLGRLVEEAWAELDDEAPKTLEAALAALLRSFPEPWPWTLPIIESHVDLAERSLRERRYAVASYASSTAKQLAEARAAALGSREAREESAAVVTSLAKLQLEGGSMGRAEELLNKALALDRRQPEALLTLAVLLEKRGLYEDAMRPLRRLLKVKPEHREAQLRLALCQVRLGETAAGRRGLEAVAQAPGRGWSRLVAHQELVRVHNEKGQTGQAAEVLGKALELWPGNRRLQVLQALLLDAERRFAAARALVTPLRGGDTGGEVTERERYNQWPAAELQGLEDRLRQASAEAQPELLLRLAREPEAG